MCRRSLVLHKGWIILRVEASTSPRHICDISWTLTNPLRIDGRTGRDDSRSAGLGDGGKNAVQGGLKANHLALHNLTWGMTKGRGEKRGETHDILAFEAG